MTCAVVLEREAWACPACGAMALVAPPEAAYAVVVDEIAAMATRKEMALLASAWGADGLPETLAGRFKTRVVLTTPVTLAAARAVEARLKRQSVPVRVVEAATLRQPWWRRVLTAGPLSIGLASVILGWLLHPVVLVSGVALALALALVRSGDPRAVVEPIPVPPLPPKLPELLALVGDLNATDRERVGTLLHGAARLLAGAGRSGLAVDPALDYGMGSTVAGVVAEAAVLAAGIVRRDAEAAGKLVKLAATVTQATGTDEAKPTPDAAERLLREAAFARSVGALPSTPETEPR